MVNTFKPMIAIANIQLISDKNQLDITCKHKHQIRLKETLRNG